MSTWELTPRFQRLNAVGRALAWMGIRPGTLEPEALRAAAVAETGLDDFGSDEHVEALDVLMGAVKQDPYLSPLGRFGASKDAQRHLSTRLRVVDAAKRDPEAAEAPLPPLLFITGFPRTGSTLLHRLLNLDPEARSAPYWELMEPVPWPEADDPAGRVANTEAVVKTVMEMNPAMARIHPLRAAEPEEEFILLQQSFATSYYALLYEAPSYVEWLRSADLRPAYRFMRLQLRLMQRAQPGVWWALKSPFHLFNLDALMDVFPDATILHLHRALPKVAGSGASLIAVTRAFQHSPNLPERAGTVWRELWSESLNRALAARDARPKAHLIDVHYSDLIQDPLATVRGIREQMGLPFSDAHGAALTRWLSENPRGAHGKHSYTLEEFGLSLPQLQETFGGYAERFGVSLTP